MANNTSPYQTKYFTPSIINQQIEQISRPFGEIASYIFANFPPLPKQLTDSKTKDNPKYREPYEEQVMVFLSRNWIENTRMTHLMNSIAITAANNPRESVTEFLSLLPLLSFAGKDPPVNPTRSNLSVSICHFFSNVDYSNLYHRIGFNFLIDQFISKFFLHLIYLIDPSDEPTMASSLNFIIKRFFGNPESSPLFDTIRSNNMSNWTKIVGIISGSKPALVFSEVFKNIPQKKDNVSHYTMYFSLFSDIYYNGVVSINEYLKQIEGLLSYAESTSEGTTTHNMAISFLCNLFGNILNHNPDLRSHSIVYDASESAKRFQKKNTYVGPAYEFRTLVYLFSQHKKLTKTINEYIRDYFSKSINVHNAGYQLRAMNFLIRGKHYLPNSILDITHEQYNFWKENPQTDVSNTVLNIVLENNGCYSNCQRELADIFIQIASVDFQIFVNSYLSRILNINFVKGNEHSVLLAAIDILSPTKRFLSYANIVNTSQINSFVTQIMERVQNVVSTIPFENTLGIYVSSPFVETLYRTHINPRIPNLDCNDPLLEVAISELSMTSEAIPFVQPEPKSFSQKQQKSWTCKMSSLICPYVFEQFPDYTFKSANITAFNYDMYYSSLAIFSQIQLEERYIKLLIPIIIIENPHVSSFSLRVIQASIHRNPAIFCYVLSTVCDLVPKSIECLFLKIQALHDITQTGMLLRASIEQSTLEVLFTNILIALCSPSAILRGLTFKLSKLIGQIAKGSTPNMYDFVSNNNNRISTGIQDMVINAGLFQSGFDISDVEDLSFEDFCRSRYSSLYMCALAVLGRFLSQSPTGDYVRRSLGILIASANTMGSQTMYKANVFAFIATYSDEVSQHAVDAINCLNEMANGHLFCHYSFFVSLSPQISHSIIQRMELRNPFDYHIISCVLRYIVSVTNDLNSLIFTKCQEIIVCMMNQGVCYNGITFSINQNAITVEHLTLAICNVMVCLNVILKAEFNMNSSGFNGPYPTNLMYTGKMFEGELYSRTFAFLINVSCAPSEDRFSEMVSLSKKAVSIFSRMYKVPDHEYNILSDNRRVVASISSDLLSSLLSAFFQQSLPNYIAESLDIEAFFGAIAKQFPEVESVENYIHNWSQISVKEMNQREKDLASVKLGYSGSLIALSLFFLCSPKLETREYGFQVLIGLVIPSAFLLSSKERICSFMQLMTQYQKDSLSLHPDLSQSSLFNISKSIKDLLPSIAEQILYQAFIIFKKLPNSYSFLHVIIPFIKGFVFDNPNPGLTTLTDPNRVRFTGFSFIKTILTDIISLPLNKHHFELIDSIVDQECKGSVLTVEFIMLSVYSIQKYSPSLFEKCIAFVTYLASKFPTLIVNHLVSFLTFKSWFYHQIQLSRIDLEFDIDKFMENIQEQNAQAPSKESHNIKYNDIDDDDEAPLYDIVVLFTLKSLHTLYLETPHVLDHVMPTVIVFCLVHFDKFNELPSALLSSIVESTSITQSMLLHNFLNMIVSSCKVKLRTSIDDINKGIFELSQILKAKLSIIASTMKKVFEFSTEDLFAFTNEALMWGLICGEMELSYRALIVYSLSMYNTSPSIISSIIRTITVITSMLTERTDPSYRVQSKQWIAVLMEKKNPNYDLAHLILSKHIDILDKSSQLLDKPSLEAFFVALEFLKCHPHNQNVVYSSSLKLILHTFQNPKCDREFIQRIPKGFLLPHIYKAQHSQDSLEVSIELMLFLSRPEYIEVLTTSSPEIMILTLLPQLWERRRDAGMAKSIQSLVSITNSDEIKSSLREISGTPESYIPPVVSCLLLFVNSQSDLSSLIDYFTTLINKSLVSLAPILAISIAIISNQVQLVSIEKFGQIAGKAVSDSDCNNSLVASLFLSILSRNGGSVCNAITPAMVKQFPQFQSPIPFNFASWQPPENIDPFSSFELIPPMSIIDIEYIACSSLKTIQQCVQLVITKPFSMWNGILFQAESINLSQSIIFEPSEIRIPEKPESIIKSIIRAFNTDNVNSQVQESTTSTESENKHPEQKESYIKSLAKVPMNTFLPSKNEFQKIGQELLGDIILPNF